MSTSRPGTRPTRPTNEPARGRQVGANAKVGHPRRRARILLVGTLMVFSLFAAQLLRIQGFDAASVSAQALDSRLHQQTIPALRGEIVSSDGTVLASSVTRYDITDDPTATVTYTKTVNGSLQKVGLAGAAQDIATAINGQSAPILAAMQSAYSVKSRFTYLAKNVTPQQWAAVDALGIPGIYSQSTQERNYPQGTALAPLLGWVNASGQPGGGVELQEQAALNGKPGVHVYEQSPSGAQIATGDNKDTPAVNGGTVELTINNNIQWYAQNALAAAVQKYGALSGDVVVMDKHQNLLAVASYPSFDNNDMAEATGTTLTSRPFTESYEPGSTSKVITMAALLSQGVATPTTQVVVPNTLNRAGTIFHDAEPHPTEYLTLSGVLAQSSNIGTMEEGGKLSPATIYSYMKKFGLGTPTASGYPGESSGVLDPYQNWSGTQRYTVLFGQGLAITAVQEASVFATVANGGVKEPVKLVKGVQTASGFQNAPVGASERVISPSVANQLTKMLEGVVSKTGTAQDADVAGFSVAGKTGTAERYDQQLGKYDGYTGSFIGFAPANDPQYIVAVTLQRPTKASIYGGTVAAPTFSQIMTYALQQGKVPPTGSQAAPYPLTFDPSITSKK